MNKIKLFFMTNRPMMSEFVKTRMSKNAKTIVMVSLEDAKKEQNRILEKAKTV